MKTQVKSIFHELSFDEQVEHLTKVGRRALEKWGYPKETQMKLLNYTENATFLLNYEGLPQIIMRVHRLDYVSYDSIRTELQWIMDLKKETDLLLAEPLISKNDEYVETIETKEWDEKRFVVCFSYLSGHAPVDSSDSNEGVGEIIKKIEKIPKQITIPLFRKVAVFDSFLGKFQRTSKMTTRDRMLYRQLGITAATIHKQSKEWQQPAYYKRLTWDFEGTFGSEWNNFYGESYRSREWLSKREIAILDKCVELMKIRLNIYGRSKDRFGMIHSDLRTANLLMDQNKIAVLDFDDCGKGWYMYEIAGIVALIEHRADIKEIVNEVLQGYEKVLPLTNEDKQEVNSFILMRRIGMLQSLIARIGCVIPGDGESVELTPEILAFYAKGTVILAKKYIKECKVYLPVHAKETLVQV